MKTRKDYRNTKIPTLTIFDEDNKKVARVNLNYDGCDEEDDNRDEVADYVSKLDKLPEDGLTEDGNIYIRFYFV